MIGEEYLIDTNVMSELARKQPDTGVTKFFAETPRLLVSTMLFHEIRYGVETAELEKEPQLAAFLTAIRGRFADRAIPVTLEIAETAGQLRAFEKNKGRILTVADSLMAATAMVKGAVLVTRNLKDFAGLELRVVNPFTK